MTRPKRLAIGSAIAVAVGCAAGANVTTEERIQLEAIALHAACVEYARSERQTPDVVELCAPYAENPPKPCDDAPVSGDSGPPVSEWRPDLREGVRHVQGGSRGE